MGTTPSIDFLINNSVLCVALKRWFTEKTLLSDMNQYYSLAVKQLLIKINE